MMDAVVPWEVAEAIVLRLSLVGPRSVFVVGNDRGRIRDASAGIFVVDPLAEAAAIPREGLVFMGDGATPTAAAREALQAAASACTGEVIVCEPDAPGCGLGPTTLRRIDPAVARIRSDEVPADGRAAGNGTRRRKPWEAPTTWWVAQAAAWRFLPYAEAARAAFRGRLPRQNADTLVLACRRLQQRYGCAYEVFALAAEELGRRHDPDGVAAIAGELAMSGDVPAGVVARVRHAWIAGGGPAATTRAGVA